MTDATLYDEELVDLEEQMSNQLRVVKEGNAGADALTKAQDMLRRLTKVYQQFRVEVRMLDHGAATAMFERKVTEHQTRLNQLKEELNTAKKEQQSARRTVQFNVKEGTAVPAAGNNVDDLHADETAPSAGAAGSSGAYSLWSPADNDPEEAGRQEARGAADRIQKTQAETLQSLANTEKLLNETEVTGQDVHATLRKQTEQIEQTNTQLDEMNNEVGRASKELKAFIRRMACDRIIICFIVLIILCIIVIVVLAVLKAKPWDKDKN